MEDKGRALPLSKWFRRPLNDMSGDIKSAYVALMFLWIHMMLVKTVNYVRVKEEKRVLFLIIPYFSAPTTQKK